MVDFNINEKVMVKLTDFGRSTLRKNHDDFYEEYYPNAKFDYHPIKEDKEGWSEWQLWVLMEELGKNCGIGFNAPFETGIKICVDPSIETNVK